MTTIHETHCQTCFNVRLCRKQKLLRKERPEEQNTCPIVKCRFLCSHEFHECKLDEHELLCPKKIVSCINVEYGCPIKMQRQYRSIHLITCPASVIVCTVEWNRKPLPPWQTQPFKFQPDHLDVAAVTVDQKTVVDFKAMLPTSLRSLLQTSNRKQPIMPLGISGHRIPNSILIQTKRERDALSDNSEIDEEDFSFSESPGGSKKSPPGLQESVCNKLKELSLTLSPGFGISESKSINGHMNVSGELSNINKNNGETNLFNSLPNPSISNHSETLTDTTSVCDGVPVKKKSDALSLIVDVTSKGACKYMNLYTFMCAREFRRDEYPGHFKSVHNEILTQLNGWLFTRCPLANYGCPFGIERIFPAMSSDSEDEYQVVYNSDVGSFCFTQRNKNVMVNEYGTSLCNMPYEILVLLTKYLDPLSLNALSMTNTLLRSVCQHVVVERGIVVFDWECNLATGKWEVAGKKWIFSTAFSPMANWKFSDVGVVSNHMTNCSHFNELRHRPERPFCYPVNKEEL